MLKERSDNERQLVLVVEDEFVIREFVCEMLELEGYDSIAVENADLALKELNENAERFDLLMTDIRMPGSMDGVALADRARLDWPRLPILVMSGHETRESSGVAKEVTFLRKPWTIGQMIDSVEQALGCGAHSPLE
jgi:DNA-binding NtrC family response regulator